MSWLRGEADENMRNGRYSAMCLSSCLFIIHQAGGKTSNYASIRFNLRQLIDIFLLEDNSLVEVHVRITYSHAVVSCRFSRYWISQSLSYS